MHVQGRLHLKFSAQEWIQSFSNIKIHIVDPGYIALVRSIVQEPLEIEKSEEKLSEWYAEHIVPVLKSIVTKRGYTYYGPSEGVKVEREWGYNGYNMHQNNFSRLMSCVLENIPDDYKQKLMSVLLQGYGNLNCVLWPCPYIARPVVSGDLLFIPSRKNLRNISLGHIAYMAQSLL